MERMEVIKSLEIVHEKWHGDFLQVEVLYVRPDYVGLFPMRENGRHFATVKMYFEVDPTTRENVYRGSDIDGFTLTDFDHTQIEVWADEYSNKVVENIAEYDVQDITENINLFN